MVDINVKILQLPVNEGKMELAKLEDRGYLHVVLVYPVLEHDEYNFPEIVEKFNELKRETKNINLMLGNLIHYHNSMIHRLHHQQILTLNNSKYILLSIPYEEKPKLLTQAITALNDYKIILSQPHNCSYFHYKELVELKEMGVQYLISYDDTKNRIVRKLLKKKMIDYIVYGLGNGFEMHKKAEKLIDEEYSQNIVSRNFNQIIHKP